MNYIWIFIGGGLGSLARFELGQKVMRFTGLTFPWATIAVNVCSCFIMGLFISLFEGKGYLSQTAKLFIGIGFCGGFSTFSAFTAETFELLKAGSYFFAGVNVLLSVVICLFSFWAGWTFSKIL